VQDGSFRADLYARLAQWLIQLPPLRERRDDLPEIIPFLLGRLGAGGRTLDLSLTEALLLHPWPLNVRGLLNALSIALISSDDGGPLCLSPDVRASIEAERAIAGAPAEPARHAPEEPPTPARPFPPPIEVVKEALAAHSGNVSAAARALGCSRQQLYRLMEARQIDLDELRPD
jgi:DNA-binding NtrC family response regulator